MKTIFFSLLLTVTLFATSSHAAQKAGADIKKDSMENNPKAAKQQYSKPTDNELRRKLTPMQYNVTQKGRTEPPFKNEYWDNNSPGIYVDVVSGEPLFSSLDKFDSQTGWPSFVKPLIAENVSEKKDEILFLPRTEVRSYLGDSHLGYVFNDGPKPTGLKYCINSAALRFIPVGGLKKAGYGRFLPLFKSRKIRHK